MNKEKGIKISPNYYQQDWRELNLNKKDPAEWGKAIQIFQDRLEGRYFKQIEALDKNPDKSIALFSGFAVMSIACLLMETIEQFWNGNIDTSRKRITGKSAALKEEPDPICNDAYAFHDFFSRNRTFATFFDTPEKANVFYTKIRCGLLHSGQTKGKSLIHVRDSEPILRWIDENNINEGISIQRRLFVDEIRSVYNSYIEKLRELDLNFNRKTFIPKMNYIVSQK